MKPSHYFAAFVWFNVIILIWSFILGWIEITFVSSFFFILLFVIAIFFSGISSANQGKNKS